MITLLLSVLLLGAGQDWGLDPHFFQHPVEYASAKNVGDDVVISVTYTDTLPQRVCVGAYAVEDADFISPQEERCFTPSNILGDFYVWPKQSLATLGNILVTITYPSGRKATMALVYKES